MKTFTKLGFTLLFAFCSLNLISDLNAQSVTKAPGVKEKTKVKGTNTTSTDDEDARRHGGYYGHPNGHGYGHGNGHGNGHGYGHGNGYGYTGQSYTGNVSYTSHPAHGTYSTGTYNTPVTYTSYTSYPATTCNTTGYYGNGYYNAPVAMHEADFNAFIHTMHNMSFENTRLTLAKELARNNYLTTWQIKAIMGEFNFENSRLDFAKFAYSSALDRQNYYSVADMFHFESSAIDLIRYIQQVG